MLGSRNRPKTNEKAIAIASRMNYSSNNITYHIIQHLQGLQQSFFFFEKHFPERLIGLSKRVIMVVRD